MSEECPKSSPLIAALRQRKMKGSVVLEELCRKRNQQMAALERKVRLASSGDTAASTADLEKKVMVMALRYYQRKMTKPSDTMGNQDTKV